MTGTAERPATAAGEPRRAAAEETTVVVVSFETREHVLACLRALREGTRTPLQVVVVDNASADGSADAVAREHPWVELLRLPRNAGFGAACNAGARLARGRELLFLNPDARVRPGAVDRLVGFSRSLPDPAVCGGRTFRSDGRPNPASCWARPTAWSVLCQGLGLTSLFRGRRPFDMESIPGWDRDTRRTVDVVSGCFMLVPRDLWERLGGFDERFFVYGEDADLCLRADELGIERWIVPEAEVVHDGAGSERVRADKLVRLFTAKAQLLRKHWPPLRARFGVAMLDMWAATRLAAHALLAPFAPRFADGRRTWRDVWRRRRAWREAE